jgi:hypothetical protein
MSMPSDGKSGRAEQDTVERLPFRCCRGDTNSLLRLGANMRRCLLYAALILYFSGTFATAGERYGAWLLEYPRSSVVTLSSKRSVTLNNEVATSELGFVCDQGDHSRLVAVLVPFNGNFESRRDVVPVWIRKRSDKPDPFDLLQKWKNGNEYIFLDTKDEVHELASFLEAEETDSKKSTYFYFPKDGDANRQNANHIVIDVSGFSDGFSTFQKTCVSAR